MPGRIGRVCHSCHRGARVRRLLGLYPVFLMKLLCFAMFACAFNLLLGYTKMLSFGHAAYFGSSAYITGWLMTVHGWGTVAGDSRRRRRRHAARPGDRRDRRAPPGDLLCDDHAGFGATGVLHVSAGAISPAERMVCRAFRGAVVFGILVSAATGPCITSCWRYSSPSSRSFVASCIRPSARCSKPFAPTSHAPSRSGTRLTATNWWPSCCRPVSSGFAGSLKAMVLGFVTLSDVSQGTSGEVIS